MAQPSSECMLPTGGSEGTIDFGRYVRPIGTSLLTNSGGARSYAWRAQKSRYRVVAPQVIVGSRPRHVCGPATSPVVTRT